MENGIQDQIARGFESVAKRFEERGAEISNLSNELTKVSTNLEHLTKTMEKLDRDISILNLHGMRAELVTCQNEVKELKETQKRNNWYIVTSLITAVIALLTFIGQFIWQLVLTRTK